MSFARSIPKDKTSRVGQLLGEELACGCHNLANVLWHKVGTNVRRTFNKEQLFAGRSSRLDMGIFRHIACIGHTAGNHQQRLVQQIHAIGGVPGHELGKASNRVAPGGTGGARSLHNNSGNHRDRDQTVASLVALRSGGVCRQCSAPRRRLPAALGYWLMKSTIAIILLRHIIQYATKHYADRI